LRIRKYDYDYPLTSEGHQEIFEGGSHCCRGHLWARWRASTPLPTPTTFPGWDPRRFKPYPNKESAVKEADVHADYPDFDQCRIVASDINWEDASLTCDNCNQRIESAYGEQQGGAE
jgi:hypothetical protein